MNLWVIISVFIINDREPPAPEIVPPHLTSEYYESKEDYDKQLLAMMARMKSQATITYNLYEQLRVVWEMDEWKQTSFTCVHLVGPFQAIR